MTWGAVAGAAVSVVGGALSAKSADSRAKKGRKAAKELGKVAFNPKSISGPGGLGVSFGEDGTSFELGDFQQLFDMFGDASEGSLQRGLGLQGASGQFLPGMFQGIGQTQQLGNEAFDRIGDLQFGGFQRGLQDTLFGGAQGSADRLGVGFDQTRANTLDLLRRQAQPFEDRAFSGMLDNQFAQGRLGSSGGALQTEAFARGLGQADLSRQLAAGDEARNEQQSLLGLLGGQLAGGSGLAGQESDLLSQAFSQFGATQGLAADLQGNIFNQGSSLFNQGGQALGGQNALLGMLMQLGGFSGDLEAQRSGTELQAKGGEATHLGNIGADGDDMIGSFLGSLGSNISPGTGLAGLFTGGGGTPMGGQPSTMGGFGMGAANPFAGMFPDVTGG